jgi:transposase
MGTDNPPSDPRDVRIAELEVRNAQLESRNAQLEARIAKLEALLAAANRSGKRQSAPFSKGPPKADPKKPGRKPGEDYGPVAHRAVPPVVDEEYDVPVTKTTCGKCGCGEMTPDGVVVQYQTEIPRRPIHRKFTIHVSRCVNCNARVQGRHPLQTSDAVGCCASQLGPDAQAAIVHLNKVAGLPLGKITDVFSKLFGITVTRGGVCQAMLRAARRCQGVYNQIVQSVGEAPWLVPDETGWRIGGMPAWLHVCVIPGAVAFHIDRFRGFDGSSQLIPEDYIGTMIHDGYKPYLRYFEATHQTCLGHLLRRSHEILEKATGGAVVFPRKIKAILQESLALRDQRDAGEITPKQAAKKAQTLKVEVRRLTERPKTNAENDRFSRHLYENQNHLFTFLQTPGIDATNYKAEQAIRPAVVNRKVWGGNRTEVGAKAQSILMSVVQTATKRGIEAVCWMSQILTNATTTLALPPPDPQID